MIDILQFLQAFHFRGELFLCVGDPENTDNWIFADASELAAVVAELPSNNDVFFGPAPRASLENTKKAVLGSTAVWSDADSTAEVPPTILPPSAINRSGEGYHLYWFMPEPINNWKHLERINKGLAYSIPGADRSVWNCNRLMRVPGTTNTKDYTQKSKPLTGPGSGHAKPVRNVKFVPELTYTEQELLIASTITDVDVARCITTGALDRVNVDQPLPSRSERDYFVISRLCAAGFADETIAKIFSNAPIGDRMREESDGGDRYLRMTIDKARADMDQAPSDDDAPTTKGKRKKQEPVQLVFEEREGNETGYWIVGKAARQVSTFTLQPKMVLDGAFAGVEDAIICDIEAQDTKLLDVTLPRSAFNTRAALQKQLRSFDLQWLGSESDLLLLVPFIMDQIRARGIKKVTATPVLGMHTIGDARYFIGDKATLTSEQQFDGTTGAVAWLPTNKTHPEMHLIGDLLQDDVDAVKRYLPSVNQQASLWCMVGWFAASAFKPWLKVNGVRFPHLHPTGTKGSGKTELTKLLMRIFGQLDPKPFDAGTTTFVTLALLGSTNAIPVFFDEFRYDTVAKFEHYLRMAYDSGMNARGKADQTTVEYELSAPIIIAGEDMISDAAIRERIIIARMAPDATNESGEMYTAFKALHAQFDNAQRARNGISDPSAFGAAYLQFVLREVESGAAKRWLDLAHQQVHEAFPGNLPDRVRNNFIAVWFGVLTFCAFSGVFVPGADVLAPAIGAVVNMDTGRAQTQADEFVTSVINALNTSAQHRAVPTYFEKDTGTLWFAFRQAHDWWLIERRKQARGALELDALRAQFSEAPYSTETKRINGQLMRGVRLADAIKHGLEVRDSFDVMTIQL
jgi:hypothetical protein